MERRGIELDHVAMAYGEGKHRIAAVDDVCLKLEPGKTLCLVGESGCGKSTTARIVAGLLTPTAGRVLYHGRDLATLPKDEARQFRRKVQLIHQDPYASLNPFRTIAQTLAAPLQRHKLVPSRAKLAERLAELLTQVGLTPPENFLSKYPFQLSGGQRQRVSIARALTVNPEFIVADEAVSMVDVSLRMGLLNLLLDLQSRLGVTFLMITHDLAVAKHFAWEGEIGVMYLGRIVELSPTPQLIDDPIHPYTRALLSSLPEADPRRTRSKERLALRSTEIPSLLDLPSGCAFHPRCPFYEPGICDRDRPEPDTVRLGDRTAACFVTARDLQRGDADGSVAGDAVPLKALAG